MNSGIRRTFFVSACILVITTILVYYLLLCQLSDSSNSSRYTQSSVLTNLTQNVKPSQMTPPTQQRLPPKKIKAKVDFLKAFSVSLDKYEFDSVILTSGSVSYNDMKALCDNLKDSNGLETHYPIYSITKDDGARFFKTLGGVLAKHERNLLASESKQVFIWTGAYFNATSNRPSVLHLPGQHSRAFLGHLEKDWCPESRDYNSIITNTLASNIKAESDNYERLLHVVFKYARTGTVCLHLYDEFAEDDDEITQPIAACQSRVTEFQPCENCNEEPHRVYYLPRVINNRVSYSNARKQCNPLHDYEYDLNGLDQANVMFLSATEKIVAEAHEQGVWVGGQFDLKSDYPYHVRWLDGRVSDSAKSPDEIWCRHPKKVIAELLNIIRDRLNVMETAIVPIVRLKDQSKCLTLHADDVFWPDASLFYPLCVTKPLQIFLKMGTSVVVSPFYDESFDKAESGFVNLVKFHLGEDRTKTSVGLINASPYEPYIILGLKELVTYNYAQELCRHFRAYKGPKRGSLVTDTTLHTNYLYMYKWSTTAHYGRLKSAPVIPSNTSFTTAGRFDFGPTGNFRQLQWHVNNTVREGNMDIAFGWCSSAKTSEILAQLEQLHGNFTIWYNAGGRYTSGPYHVYVAIESKPFDSGGACLRLVTDDLYWPGKHMWGPLCEAPNIKE